MAKNVLVLSMCITLITASPLYPRMYLAPPGLQDSEIPINREYLLSHALELFESPILTSNPKHLEEIEIETLKLLNEGEIIHGFFGFCILALKDLDRASILIKKIDPMKIKITDTLTKEDEQLLPIPFNLKPVIIKLCRKHEPKHIVAILDTFINKFYLNYNSSPDRARAFNKAIVALLTYVINTLIHTSRERKKYFAYVVAIITSLTRNITYPNQLDNDISNFFITSRVMLLFKKGPPKQIRILPGRIGRLKHNRFLILIHTSH